MQYIHETVLRDVIDLVQQSKDWDVLKRYTGDRSIKSIASASAGLTMVFPHACSSNISIENSSMVSKALERKQTMMLQLLLTANSMHDNVDVYDYLKKFHSNLKIDNNITVDSMIDLMDKMVMEEHVNSLDLNKANYLLQEDAKRLDYYLDDSISEYSLNERFNILPKNKYGSTIVSEANRQLVKVEYDLKNVATGAAAMKKFRTDNNLLSSDVRKANELIDTMLVVNVSMKDSCGNQIPNSFIIGVKSKIYPIDSADVIDRLVDKSKNSNGLNKFIRASTREISFFKDFLFAIDQAKLDALSQSSKGSSNKLWKILERRAKNSKLKRNLGIKNDCMAITTLSVSQQEIDFIKKEHNINLEDPKNARKILEIYNLLGFVIVDQTNEVAKFLFDTGEDMFEHLSFSSLERESSDSQYRKIINLISKVK